MHKHIINITYTFLLQSLKNLGLLCEKIKKNDTERKAVRKE
jgi:hypothetical protein